jgi:Zn-dependent protease
MRNVLLFVIQIGTLLFAISIHESAHAWMADRFGDPTAKLQGRITLNPVAHIDPIGTVVFPILLFIMGAPVFGWAKPVMVNPLNLRNPRKDDMYISAAGPVSNIMLCVSAIVLFLVLKQFGWVSVTGGGIEVLSLILFYLIVINIWLAIFNLIPIPPLDGSGIIEGLLEGEALHTYQKLKPYGFLILLLVIYTGVLNIIARPILKFIYGILI